MMREDSEAADLYKAVYKNPIVATGFQVVIGALRYAEAQQVLLNDKSVSDQPDDRLAALLQTAQKFYDNQFAEGDAAAATVYLALAARCCEARMKAIGELRQAEGKAPEGEWTKRFADWIGVTARCLLSEAMGYLLVPDLRVAFEAFFKGEMCARALPDLDIPRDKEMCWGIYGRAQVAARAGQERLAAEALAQLRAKVEGDESLKVYVDELSAKFTRFWDERRRLQAEHPELGKPAATGSTGTETNDKADEHYVARLSSFLRSVESGQMSLAKACSELAVDPIIRSTTPGQFEIASQLQETLARREPARAIILATLARAALAASPLRENEWLQAKSLRALGYAQLGQALAARDKLELFAEARSNLEAALARFDAEAGPEEAAQTVTWLALADRGHGDFDRALERNRDAIRRLNLIKESPFQQEALAVAIGNLADVEENTGQPLAALQDHYRAYRIFLKIKESSNAKKALLYFSALAFRLGRSDEVVVAAQDLLDLLMEVAGVADVVSTYLMLAASGFRIGRLDKVVELLQTAEKFLEPRMSKADEDTETLRLMQQTKLWHGAVLLALIGKLPGQDTLTPAIAYLDEARKLAERLNDPDDYAECLTLMARAHIEAGHFTQALDICDLVDDVPCGPLYRTERDDARGHALMGLGRYAEAVQTYQAVLVGFSGHSDKTMGVLERLGQAYESLGKTTDAVDAYTQALDLYEKIRMALSEQSRMDFRTQVDDAYKRIIMLYSDPKSSVYDAAMAFEWTERSKSRTFLEMMGRSQLPLPDAPDEIRPKLLQERHLVDQLNGVGTPSSADPLGESLEAIAAASQLDALWSELEAIVPEYVSLRKGTVTDFRAVKDRLAERAPAERVPAMSARSAG